MFRSIMVPLDGSPFAEQALPYAVAVARRAGATLDLMRVHVIYAMQPTASSWLPYQAELEHESRCHEAEYLSAVAECLEPHAGVQVRTGLAEGLGADGILAHARDTRADLIVMTTHGAGPVGRVLLGSTADELVRRTETPLFLIRPRAGEAADPGEERVVRHVLIALDGSAPSEQILDPAVSLGWLSGAAFTLLHVETPAEARDRGTVDARPYLENLAEPLRRQECAVRVRAVKAGSAATAILKEAADADCDLIALATHGRGGLTRLLMGSVAEKVLRDAPCPVLTVKTPAAVARSAALV